MAICKRGNGESRNGMGNGGNGAGNESGNGPGNGRRIQVMTFTRPRVLKITLQSIKVVTPGWTSSYEIVILASTRSYLMI